MNILLVDQYSEMGGAQHCLLDLVPGVWQRGWNCIAALPGDGPLIGKLETAGVAVERIPCGPYAYGRKSFADYARFLMDTPRAAARIRRIVAERHIDLVYCNGPRVLPAASLSGATLIYHAHSVLTRGHDFWMIRRCTRHATIVAASEFVAQSLRAFCTLHIVPNGTEDLGFRPWTGSDVPRIGIIGRIAPEKGQLAFVEAARMLAAQDARCRFVICGEPAMADPSYAEEVRRRAAGLPVEFTGRLDSPRQAMAAVDILAVPSGVNEAFGRVVVEAFSAGVPVVAFAAGGIPELIKDERTGFLTQQRSAESLATRLREVLVAQDQLDHVTRAARTEWKHRYTVERYRDHLLGLMEEAVLRSRNQKSRPARTATTPADKSMAG